MKPKDIIFIVLLTTSLFLFSKKPVFAVTNCDSRCASSQEFADENECTGPCAGCDWCITPAPTEPTEDVEGKVINPILPKKLTTMPGATFLSNFLKTGINLVLLAGAVIFFFILTSGGIRWLSSSGDKAKLESAQKQISSGLVGLVILLSSFAIIKLIETLFGINLLNITLPTL